MNKRINTSVLGLSAAAVLGGAALGSPLIANAQSSPTTPSPSSTTTQTPAETPDGAQGRGGRGETPVTGAAADSAKQAALASTGGGTADRVTTENDGPAGAAYEVHVTKTDGSRVKVLLDSAFKVVATETGGKGGKGGKGGRDGGPEHAPLAPDIATKVSDAAKAAVPGGTVTSTSAETKDAAGAAYEAHVTKTDGSKVELVLDQNFTVLTTQPAKGGRG